MTVCIAAICRGHSEPYIIGATDRMLTAGDIQFEPQQRKVWVLDRLTSPAPGVQSILALTAGDSASQAEICGRVCEKQPSTVYEAASLYSRELGRLNQRQAERNVLFPLGLSMKSFLRGQHAFTPEFVEHLRYSISKERAEVAAIVCGIDTKGPHLYVIYDDGRVRCHTSIGFSAIGEGERHSLSQFMFAKHTPEGDLAKSMMLLFTAKKRAEVASTVGSDTDLFFITSRAGYRIVHDHNINVFKDAYDTMIAAQSDAESVANATIDDFFEQISQTPPKFELPAVDSPEPESTT